MKSPQWNSLWAVVSLSALVISSPSAQAASATWNGTTDALWATPGDWSTTPVPGTGDTATFNNAGNAHTTISLGSGVTINTIIFDTASAAAYTIGSGAVGSQALTLNNGGAVTMNSTVANNELFNSVVDLGTDGTAQGFTFTNNSTAKTLTFAGAINGSTGAGLKTLNIAGAGSTTISGAIGNGTTGTVGVAVNTTGGSTILSGANTFTGGLILTAGTLDLNNTAALGAVGSTFTITSGTIDNTSGSSKTMAAANPQAWNGSFNFGGTGALLFGAGNITSSGNVTVTNSGASLLTEGGAVSGTSNLTFKDNVAGGITFSLGVNNTGTITNSGAGTGTTTISGVVGTNVTGVTESSVGSALVFTNTDTYTGATTVNAGTLSLSGSGNLTASAVTLNSSTILAIADNASSGNLTRAGNVTAGGGVITVTGSTANSNDTITTLTLNPGYVSQPAVKLSSSGASSFGVGGGDNTIVVAPGTTGNTLLTIGTLTQNTGGAVEFTTDSSTVALGTDTIASATAGQVNIAITNAPTLVGGGGALSTTTTSIIPFAVGAVVPAATANAPTDFVTYTSANGVQLLTNYTSTFAASVAGSVTTSNLKETANDSIAATTTINSLVVSGANAVVLTLASQTLNVTSGAVLLGGGNSYTIGVVGATAGTLALGTGNEAFIETGAGRIDIINSAITGSTHGLTITAANVNNAASTLIFAGTNTYSGGTVVNGGGGTGGGAILQIGGTSATTATATGQLGSGNVVLNDATLAFALTVNETVAGNISSSAGSGLGAVSTKAADTGIITLSGTNTYTGGTAINGGTIQFANYGAMPGTGTVTVASGATLGVNAGGGGTEWTNGTSGAGTIGGLFTGVGGQGSVVTLNSGSAVGIDTTNAGGSLTYAGNITGAPAGVGLTKLGTGTLILSGASTYTGATTSKSGTLELSGSLTGSNVATSGTGNFTEDSGGVIAGASNTFTQASTGTSTFDYANNTYGGGTFINGGTLVLGTTAVGAFGTSNTVTFNSTTGSLDIATDTNIDANTTYAVSVGALDTGTIIADRATGGVGITQTLGAVTMGAGNGNGGGRITISQGTNVTSGVGTIALGNVSVNATGGTTTLNINSGNLTVGSVTPIASTANTLTLDLSGGGGTGNITGTIEDPTSGGGKIAVVDAASGSNVWTLSGANTYTGGTSFTISGTLVAANVQAFGLAGAALSVGNQNTVDLATDSSVDAWATTVSLSAGQAATIESDVATPNTAGITQTLGTLSIGGSATTAATLNIKSGPNVNPLDTGTSIVAFGAVTLNNTGTVTTTFNPTTAGMTMTSVTGTAVSTKVNTISLGGSATDNAITGVIADGAGTGKVAVTSSGTGVWVLSGANTYTGGTAVTTGTLQVGNGSSGSIGSSAMTVAAAGTLAFDEANNATQAGNIVITGAGAVVGNEGSSITNTLSGVISGATGTFTQNGAGTTILSNTANSYGGATNINAGTLVVSGDLTTSAVLVNNGGTLAGSGNGTTTGHVTNSVTVISGGNINLVDNSIGTLTVGSLSTTAANLTFEIGTSTGSIDKIADAGGLTIGSGTTTINIDNLNNAGSQTLANGSYTLLTYTGTASGSLGNFVLSTPSQSLDGKSLTLSTATTGSLILTVGNLVTTTGTTYNLSASVADARVLQFGSTTVTATITNVGTGTADTLDYVNLQTNGSISGGTLPMSGGPLDNATNAVSGSNSNSGTATLSAGFTTGSMTITPQVDSATNHTLASNPPATLGTVTTATVDVVAQRTINNGNPTDLGTLHSGAVVSATTAANPFNSAGTHDTTTDVSVAGGPGSGSPDANGVDLTGASTTFNGASSGVVNGATQTFGGTITNGSGGTTTGEFDLAVNTLENGGAGLDGEGPYDSVAIDYTAFVYTGQGVWNTNGDGSWGAVSPTPTNWTANGGTPGLDSNFTTTDSATFDNTALAPGSSATVTLDGDNPSLNAITFNTTGGGGYTLAQGTGGSITLDGGASPATVTVLSGDHTISAPVILATNANVDVASGQQLTISGAISGTGTGLTTTDSGTLVLSGTSSYSGATVVNAGTLSVTGSIANSAVSVANGATLSGTGTTGAVSVAAGGNINLQDGTIGTLTVGGLSAGDPSTPSAFSFDIQTVLGTTSTDLIADTGTLTLTGANGTTITIGGLSGTTSLTSGNYALLTYTGTQQSLSNLNLLTTSLDGDTLSLTQTGDTIYLTVFGAAGGPPASAYYTGVSSTDMNTAANFVTTADGGTATSTAIGLSTDVYLTANSASNTGPTLNTGAVAINSLTFTGTGTSATAGVTLSGSDTLTIGGGTGVNTPGIYVQAGSGTNTISTPLALGVSQSWSNASSNLLTVSGGVSGTGNLALQANSTGGITLSGGSVNNIGSITNSGSGAGTTTISSTIGSNVTTVTENSSTSTMILSGNNTYTGGTAVTHGTLYVNGGSTDPSSGSGTGAVTVASGATLGGSGVIGPTVSGAGVTLASGATLISGGIQAAASPTTTAGQGLTLDNRVAAGTILDASVGTANLTFSLGAGNPTSAGIYTFNNPNTASTYMTVLGNTAGEIKLASGDTITLTDLTAGNLQLNLSVPYLLIEAGTTPDQLIDNNLYSGIATTGGVLDGVLQNGWVTTPFTIAGSVAGEYPADRLYLDNGMLEVVPEPSTWAMMLGGLAVLAFIQRRRKA